MDTAQSHPFENKLRSWREALERQLRRDERIAADPDPLVRQSEEMVSSLENLWRRTVVVQIREIDLALKRLSDGAFGNCEHCGKPISRKRLDAIPWARQCLPCQSVLPEQRASLTNYAKVGAARSFSQTYETGRATQDRLPSEPSGKRHPNS